MEARSPGTFQHARPGVWTRLLLRQHGRAVLLCICAQHHSRHGLYLDTSSAPVGGTICKCSNARMMPNRLTLSDCCLHILHLHRLAFGQIQSKSSLDHRIRPDWHCWLFHAGVPTSESAVGQVRCTVSRRHWHLFILAHLASLGGQQLCNCNRAGVSFRHSLHNGKSGRDSRAMDIPARRCAQLSYRSCHTVELPVRLLGVCDWITPVL